MAPLLLTPLAQCSSKSIEAWENPHQSHFSQYLENSGRKQPCPAVFNPYWPTHFNMLPTPLSGLWFLLLKCNSSLSTDSHNSQPFCFPFCQIKLFCCHPHKKNLMDTMLEIHKDKTLREATKMAREVSVFRYLLARWLGFQYKLVIRIVQITLRLL